MALVDKQCRCNVMVRTTTEKAKQRDRLKTTIDKSKMNSKKYSSKV